MCRIRRSLLTLLLLTLLSAALPAQAQPQTQSQVIILQTVPHAEADDQQLGLDIYFTLRRGDGTPVTLSDADLAEQGEVRLLSGAKTTSVAQISPATGPIRIALVIDASGSMVGSIDGVREAAKKAVAQAPENALIAVYAFHKLDYDQPLVPIQGYTQNHALATQALDAIIPKNGNPTCLYNTAFTATSQLNQEAAPADRRAIILFTDGKDDNGQGKPCSQRSVENVVSGALETYTPIYTIGLCSSPACSNLNADVLSQIAEGTKAISRRGVLEEMDDLFATVMDQINSQWVAQARVAASSGDNSATLIIPRNNQQVPLVGSLAFSSSRDFYAVPSFQIKARYLADQDAYELSIDARDIQSLQDMTVEAWAENSIVAQMKVPLTALSAPLLFPTKDLKVGQKYNFLLRASDSVGRPFTAMPPIIQGDPEVLAQSGELAAYQPAFSFSIETISTDWKRNELLIKLKIENASGTSDPIFSGYVNASDGEVLRFEKLVPHQDGQIRISLADARAFRSAASAQKPLQLTIVPENKPAAQPQEREFTPPSRPFDPVPWAIGCALALLVAGVVWGVLRWRNRTRWEPHKLPHGPHDGPSEPIRNEKKPPREKPESAKPNGSQATISDETRPMARQLRQLKIILINTPDLAKQPTREWIVSNSPTIIGRIATNPVNFADGGVSKTHLQLTRNGSAEWTIMDLNSANGTFIGHPSSDANGKVLKWTRINSKQDYSISSGVRVRLGEDTEIELHII